MLLNEICRNVLSASMNTKIYLVLVLPGFQSKY
jgi:hypothetical protein